jgi:hypothetical protein
MRRRRVQEEKQKEEKLEKREGAKHGLGRLEKK